MPILPVIDLLIFMGWTSISIGAVLKAIYLTTNYRPTFLGLSPLDMLIVAVVFLLFALTLAARSWVKANEPAMLAARRVQQVRDEFPENFVETKNGASAAPAAATAESQAPSNARAGAAAEGEARVVAS